MAHSGDNKATRCCRTEPGHRRRKVPFVVAEESFTRLNLGGDTTLCARQLVKTDKHCRQLGWTTASFRSTFLPRTLRCRSTEPSSMIGLCNGTRRRSMRSSEKLHLKGADKSRPKGDLCSSGKSVPTLSRLRRRSMILPKLLDNRLVQLRSVSASVGVDRDGFPWSHMRLSKLGMAIASCPMASELWKQDSSAQWHHRRGR